MSRLIVPMLVDALRVKKGASALAPPRFSELPYVQTVEGVTADVNVGRPFLAETTHSPAFTPPEFPLGVGVHLHWILPRALRTTRTDGDSVEFPPAPDQWLVVRRRRSGDAWTVEHAWRVDARYVWPESLPGDVPIGIQADDDDAFVRRGAVWPWGVGEDADGSPRFSPPTGGAPWRFVGATWPVECTGTSWSKETVPDPDPDSARLTPQQVNAGGWGDPTYAAFYPSCAGQFGLFDDGTDPESGGPIGLDRAGATADVDYVVIGWYSVADADPLATFLASLDTTDPVERRKRVVRQFGCQVEGDIPSGLILVGRVSNANFLLPAEEREALGFDVAIGGSGSHALAALLTDEIWNDTGLQGQPPKDHTERQLDALLFAKHLDGQSVDIGARLDDLVSRRLFRVKPGGKRGVIRGRPPAASDAAVPRAAPRPDEDIELPDGVATDLDALNQAQEAAEAANRRVAHLRHQLYSDWYRAILLTDPSCAFALDWVVADETDGAVTADSVYGLARRRLSELQAAVQEREAAEVRRDDAGARVEAAVAAHNALAGAAQWALDGVPAPPFFAPNEPAVALIPTGAGAHRVRWRGAGLNQTGDGALLTAKTDATPDDAASVAAILAAAGTLGLDPQVRVNETSPLRMDWEVEIATQGGTGPGGAYTADWLTAPQGGREGTIALTGSALLTDDATAVVTDALRTYVRRRLSADAVDFTAATGLETVNALARRVDSTRPGFTSTWLERAGLGSADDETLDAWLSSNAAHVRAWALARALAEALADGVRDQAAWAKAARPPRYPAQGPLVDSAWRWFSTPPIKALPEPLRPTVGGIAGWTDLVPSVSDAESGTAARLRAAFLLAAAEANGSPDAGFVYGVPRGGALDGAVTLLANTLDEDELRAVLGKDAAAAAIVDERPFDDLSDLARLPEINAVGIGGFVGRVEGGKTPIVLGTAGDAEGSTARVDPLATALAAWIELGKRGPALIHTLDGLNDALLQWDAAPQLPMEDPTGFQDHRDFLDTVLRPAVHRSRRRAPRQDFPFVPLRTGALTLSRLRLVDSFGGVSELPCKPLVAPSTWASGNPDLPVRMPPRLVQPSRLRATWLDGADPTRPWTPHPGRTPLCGWFVLDSFAGQLDVHDADGALLGGLDEDGIWRVAPGRRAPTTLAGIAPIPLAALAAKIRDEVGVQPFSDAVDRALEDVHEASSPDDQALSLLLSRPLAVVQLSLRWEAAEPLAARQDAAGLAADLLGRPDDRAVGAVELPLQIGARHRLHDGVIAWCEVTDQGLGPLQLPHLGATGTTLTLDGTRAPTLLLLVDPSAEVHLLCDLLPPTVLRLPPLALAEAARAHELLSYSGPHLTPRTGLRAPQLQETGWTATMLLPEPGQWVELGETPLVDRRALEARLDKPTGIWDRLIGDKVLLSDPGSRTLARIAPLPAPQGGDAAISLEARLAGYPDVAQLVAALAAAARTYAPHAHDLSFAPLELREAYLHLRRTTP